MALMMARLYTGNYDMLALRNGYHGMSDATMGITSHSTWKFNVPQVYLVASLPAWMADAMLKRYQLVMAVVAWLLRQDFLPDCSLQLWKGATAMVRQPHLKSTSGIMAIEERLYPMGE